MVYTVAFYGIALAIFALGTAWQKRKRNRVWGELATRYGGTLDPANAYSYPTVRLPYADTSVVIDTARTGNRQPVHAQAHFYWPDPTIRLELYPEGVFAKIRKLFGMQDIQVGSVDFDPRYIISGNDDDEVRRILSPYVQKAVDRLRYLGGTNEIYVSLVGGRLLVKKAGHADQYEQLQKFTALALEFYEHVLTTRAAGITFETPEATFSLDAAICRICGEPIAGKAVICRSCKTPHHAECWAYNGACSTYGCRQTRYQRVRT